MVASATFRRRTERHGRLGNIQAAHGATWSPRQRYARGDGDHRPSRWPQHGPRRPHALLVGRLRTGAPGLSRHGVGLPGCRSVPAVRDALPLGLPAPATPTPPLAPPSILPTL